MKKLDKLLLGAFAGPFMMTFLVVVFILLTQHMLKYFDDIIGKGLGGDVIGQLLFYFAIFMTPVALPLAVLLSSLIAFGNLGEHFELTAIKSSGISLVRTLRPIFFFVLVLTGIAFYANNNLVPKAALEAYSLLYDIKQKKPALDLREGAFYNGISDISIKVNKKFEDGITLKEVILYDHRDNDGNKKVTVADSGKMYTILNERYLKFELFNGYNYSEGSSSPREVSPTSKGKSKTESMSRSKFHKSQIVFDLSDLDLKKTDKKWFQGNRIMRNLAELESDMDSIRGEILTQQLNYYSYRQSHFAYFRALDSLVMPKEVYRHKLRRDSIAEAKYAGYRGPQQNEKPVSVNDSPDAGEAQTLAQIKRDSAEAVKRAKEAASKKKVTPQTSKAQTSVSKTPAKPKTDAARKRPVKKPIPPKAAKAKAETKPVNKLDSIRFAKLNSDSARRARIDSIFNMEPRKEHLANATNAARQVKSNIENSTSGASTYEKEMINFQIQWHKILANSLACVAMFLIGAPLGAIIKKGGLGMPFLVSIIFFIVYYIITMQGEKLAKQGTLSPLAGVWMADAILLVIGLFFLRQARADARLFEADFYSIAFDKLKQWFKKKQRQAHTPVA